MFPLIAFVGPSGCGKSSIMSGVMKNLPELTAPFISTTTRPRRGPEDDIFYEFVTADEIERRIQTGRMVNRSDYAGAIYITDRHNLDPILQQKFALGAIVEPSLDPIREAGYGLLIIKVIPVGHFDQRSEERKKQDAERAAKANYTPDFTVESRFEPGGLERAIQLTTDWIKEQAKNYR